MLAGSVSGSAPDKLSAYAYEDTRRLVASGRGCTVDRGKRGSRFFRIWPQRFEMVQRPLLFFCLSTRRHLRVSSAAAGLGRQKYVGTARHEWQTNGAAGRSSGQKTGEGCQR